MRFWKHAARLMYSFGSVLVVEIPLAGGINYFEASLNISCLAYKHNYDLANL